jgi:hypothetical protein
VAECSAGAWNSFWNFSSPRRSASRSAPIVVYGVLVGDSLTIPRADTKAEAAAPIDEGPLTKLNLRTYELRLWGLGEGTHHYQLNASAS